MLRSDRIVGQLEFVVEYHMPIKPPATEWDLIRARQIERSWTPFFLKPLSSAEAEIVTRAIAQGIALGRKEGLELAKAPHD